MVSGDGVVKEGLFPFISRWRGGASLRLFEFEEVFCACEVIEMMGL